MSKVFQCLLFTINYHKLTGVTQQSFSVVFRQLTLLLFLWDADTMGGARLTVRLVLTAEEDSVLSGDIGTTTTVSQHIHVDSPAGQ
jgi:hypothetical protein